MPKGFNFDRRLHQIRHLYHVQTGFDGRSNSPVKSITLIFLRSNRRFSPSSFMAVAIIPSEASIPSTLPGGTPASLSASHRRFQGRAHAHFRPGQVGRLFTVPIPFDAWMRLYIGLRQIRRHSSLQLRYISTGEGGDPRFHDLHGRP